MSSHRTPESSSPHSLSSRALPQVTTLAVHRFCGGHKEAGSREQAGAASAPRRPIHWRRSRLSEMNLERDHTSRRDASRPSQGCIAVAHWRVQVSPASTQTEPQQPKASTAHSRGCAPAELQSWDTPQEWACGDTQLRAGLKTAPRAGTDSSWFLAPHA